MEYTDILEAIEKQKEGEGLSAKLFRYSGLLQAIEFFSQKLNFDQIEDAAFDFSNELLTLEKSAIFVLRGDKFVLKKIKGLQRSTEYIDNTKELENIALFHGTLMYGNDILLKYFSAEIIDAYKVTISVPLIIEDYLYGFIFISCKTLGEMKDDDYIILEALMKLLTMPLKTTNVMKNFRKRTKILMKRFLTCLLLTNLQRPFSASLKWRPFSDFRWTFLLN
jgi:transcriptional regulator with GAF, ATPase, and Fis domain